MPLVTLVSSFTDTSVTNGIPYRYTVIGVNDGGLGDPSNTVTVIPGGGSPPGATLLSASPGDSSISLNWVPVLGALGYNIYRGVYSGGEDPLPIATVTGVYTNYYDYAV